MNDKNNFQKGSTRKGTSGYGSKRAGDKLKSETSARRAYGSKFRHGKKDVELTAKEKKKIKKMQVQGRRSIRRKMAENEAVHRRISDANEDQNVGTEALNKGVETADDAAGLISHRLYTRKLQKGGPDCDTDSSAYSGMGGKLGQNARSANMKAGNSNYGAGKQTKQAQKDLMKKEFQKAAGKKAEKEAANQAGSLSRKFVDKAEDLMGRFSEWICETIADHPAVILILAIILIVAVLISSFTGLAGGMLGTLSDTTIATSYTADDPDILAVEQDYKNKEAELRNKIKNIKSDHPGYDEYRLNLAEINHNPYQLAALLTVLYEDYTESEVQSKLQEIFDRQYKLTTQAVTEKRTRTETRTGTRTVTNADGTTSTEDYTYDVQVQYDWHILIVTLTNATMDSVVRDMGLTDDEMSRYKVLLETQGNKPYLFEGDVYANPNPGDYQGYKVPPEALTDQKFANMMQEAEKYLGMPYVWGGSSPSTSFDCSGFVSYVINHCGNGWNYGRQTANGLLNNCCTRVSRDEAKPGDLIFYQGTYATSGASHVGIYVGNGMMIHCGDPIQYSSINTNYWKQHFYTFGRIRN